MKKIITFITLFSMISSSESYAPKFLEYTGMICLDGCEVHNRRTGVWLVAEKQQSKNDERNVLYRLKRHIEENKRSTSVRKIIKILNEIFDRTGEENCWNSFTCSGAPKKMRGDLMKVIRDFR